MARSLSVQCKEILNILKNDRVHLTADEVYEKVSKILPGIGIATVYRNLNNLEKLGLIKKLTLYPPNAHFEFIRDGHIHFVCTKCGRIDDLSLDLSGIITDFAKINGIEYIDDVSVSITGICSECCNNKDS